VKEEAGNGTHYAFVEIPEVKVVDVEDECGPEQLCEHGGYAVIGRGLECVVDVAVMVSDKHAKVENKRNDNIESEVFKCWSGEILNSFKPGRRRVFRAPFNVNNTVACALKILRDVPESYGAARNACERRNEKKFHF
jgi:hypothetical protein